MSDDPTLRAALVETLTRRWRLVEQDDLYMLTKIAVQREEIAMSKAAELLGLPLEDMRVLMNEWRIT
jgi:predicted HTH domain antitoxin